jgi:hypothetical protein
MPGGGNKSGTPGLCFLKYADLWDVIPCSLVYIYQNFGGTASSIQLETKMAARSSFEMAVTVY